MRRIFILVFAMLFGFAFAKDVSVDSDVMDGSRSRSFVEYSGNYDSGQISTAFQIRETGRSLGRAIHKYEDDEIPFAEGNPSDKYSAGRVYGEDKAGADILCLGKSIGVDTIKCLRLIVSGYVQEAFGCSQAESDLIATAVCDWNASHYLDFTYFEKRYDTRLFSLFSERCTNIGLSSDYREWPNSRIVIPNQSAGAALMNSSFVAEVLASEEDLLFEDGYSLLSDYSEKGAVESVTDSFFPEETGYALRNADFREEKTKKKWSWGLLLLLLILLIIFLLIRFLSNGESEHISFKKGFSVSNTVPWHETKTYERKAKKSADVKFADDIRDGTLKTASLYFSCNEDSVNKDYIAEKTIKSEKSAYNGKDEKIHFYTSEEERMKYIPRVINKDGSPKGTWSGEPGNSMFIPADTPENQEIIKYLHEHGVEGIVYKDGVPDFSPGSEGCVEIPDMTEYRSSYYEPRPDGKPGNYEQAYQALADKWNKEKKDGRDDWTAVGVRRWAKPRNFAKKYKLEVHENSDTKTCEFVRHDIHMFFTHSGGREECKIRDKENGRWNDKNNNGGSNG